MSTTLLALAALASCAAPGAGTDASATAEASLRRGRATVPAPKGAGVGATPTTTTVPANTAPLGTVPVGTVPLNTGVSNTVPTNTVPTNTAALVRDTHVIYSSIPPGATTTEIYRMRTDGTDPVRLTSDQNVEHTWPRPSPDGTKILFYTAARGSSVNDINTNELWVMDSDGSNQRRLIPMGAYGWTRQGHVEWSPDGTRLLMSAGGQWTMDLYVTDTEGRGATKALERGSHMAIDPSWTPDGAGALFIGCPRENMTCWWWEYEVFRVDLGTGAEQRLTYDSFPDFDPYMSPDGSQIVWLRCTGSFPFGPWGIFRAPSAQAPLVPAAVVDDGNINSNVDFSADGSTLLFSRHVIGVTTWQSAATVRIDGSRLGFLGGGAAPVGQGTPVYWP